MKEIEIILKQMTPKQREVWNMLLEGMKESQIAQILGKSPQTIKDRRDGGIRRAERRLGPMTSLIPRVRQCAKD